MTYTYTRTDFVLGASFLRNVYILFNFGDYTSGRTGSPYIQLLSVRIQTLPLLCKPFDTGITDD